MRTMTIVIPVSSGLGPLIPSEAMSLLLGVPIEEVHAHIKGEHGLTNMQLPNNWVRQGRFRATSSSTRRLVRDGRPAAASRGTQSASSPVRAGLQPGSVRGSYGCTPNVLQLCGTRRAKPDASEPGEDRRLPRRRPSDTARRVTASTVLWRISTAPKQSTVPFAA